jgi:hypothetical protein
MTENFNSKPGEAVNNDSFVAARRSREVEERDGPRSRGQRLFWLLFWSQKSNIRLFSSVGAKDIRRGRSAAQPPEKVTDNLHIGPVFGLERCCIVFAIAYFNPDVCIGIVLKSGFIDLMNHQSVF